MGTKQNPGRFDCYEAALPDEPMFVLLARDPLAPFLVSIWSAIRMNDWEKAGVVFNAMIERAGGAYSLVPDTDPAIEAMDCSQAMFAWRQQNDGRWRTARRERLIEERRDIEARIGGAGLEGFALRGRLAQIDADLAALSREAGAPPSAPDPSPTTTAEDVR